MYARMVLDTARRRRVRYDVRGRAAVGAICVLALLLTACTGTPRGIEPVENFDGERYMGHWYEIKRLDHRFERGLRNVTAEYSLREDGRVNVTNRGLDTESCEWQEVSGTARFRGDTNTASLAVTFTWPFAGGYHVFALDDDYQWALVSGPTRGFLWLLARDPDMPAAQRERLVELARVRGFPVDDLILVDHGEPDC